ncbi:nucleotide pyrophosphohydrolase [bacterium]|nr:nucleotide pyrophosphohydrolase [bacterium]|tara:strand:+ start:10879 stop:11193 length:315 start_codon:yes stop_codon:yes gene_type:complete
MFKKVQKDVHDLVKRYDPPYWPALSQFARLSDEVGEVARLLNHMYGLKPKKKEEAEQQLGSELADVMFTVVCLANAHDIDLDEEFEKALDKLRVRDKDRFKKKG